MPIPTDTFWNIKRLNVVFAVSALLLLGVTGWAILQDFNQPWREPQRHGKVWEAAFVDEKIERDTTLEKLAEIAALQKQQAELAKSLGPDSTRTKELTGIIRNLVSDASNMEFALNNKKSTLSVLESNLQDAITAKDEARIKRLTAEVAEPRKDVEARTEALFAKKKQIEDTRHELATHTAPLDLVSKAIIKLQSDVESLKKKRAALQPAGPIAMLSQQVRETPLMQFINPATKVQQVVLNDVLTEMPPMKVPAIDRCTTCHVNIANKDFTEPKVVAYLEEQVAASRNLKLPDVPPSATGALATRTAPGAVAMPEFWHLWAVKAAPEVVRKPANLNRIKSLASTVGKQAIVTIDGKALDSFNYVPDPAKKEDAASLALDPTTRDQVVVELLRAWIGFGNGKPASKGRVQVKIAESVDAKAAAVPRTAAMKYVEEVGVGVNAALSRDAADLLTDRYRRAMITEANVARKAEGLKQLDPSPVMLAHPRLDLYVDADSKHPFEAVGCTSCHDGSGQETNFVLVAHSPRPIWVDQKTGEPVLLQQIDPKTAPASHHGEDLSSMLGAVFPHDQIVPEHASDIHFTHAGQHATTQPAEDTIAIAPPAPTNVDTAMATKPAAYVDPLTGKSGRAVPQMKHWVEKYEPGAPRGFALVYHEWDWPMRPPRYLQANCVRCHSDVNDIKHEAPQVFQGRSLFVNMGCVNCHQMDSIPTETMPKESKDVRLIAANGQRKVGTDLRQITAKVSPAYINTWIWAPKAFRPSTKMPHFFMLENNSSDEELRRTRQEARSITEYLVRTASPWTPEPSGTYPAGGHGSAEAGKVVFNSIGCLGCHTNLNDDTGEKRNNKPVTLGEKWIVTDLVKGGRLATEIEQQTGKVPDAKAVTTRATELYDELTYNERQLYVTEHLAPSYTGEAPKYPDGSLKPLFQHHGPELSGIGTKLTAGRTPEQSEAWLYQWVKNPRHYSEYTVMPSLRLSDQQAMDLTEYLLAQKRTNDKPNDPWKADLTPADTEKLIELTGLFLRSRYSAQTATKQADDDKELTDLAADALVTASTPLADAKTQAAKLTKDERRMVFLGKKLISNYGCMSCHAINGAEQLSSPCANLSDWGQKGLDKLDFGYLDHHKLETLKKDEHGNPLPLAIAMVNGVSEKAGLLTSAEWRANFPEGRVAEDVIAGWPHVDHSRTSWLTQKLKNTRIYDRGKNLLEPDAKSPDLLLKSGKPYDKLKMPTFYLNDSEVDSIVTWVISNREKLITPKLAARTNNEQAKQIARGRQLAQKFNCVGCHVIDGNQPSVQQFFKPDDITTKAPPSLRGEGNKVQHTWLFNFLKHVEPLRPLLNPPADKKPEIRMPSFPILDDESAAIAAFFNAESKREATMLARHLDVIEKYIAAQKTIAAKGKPPTASTTAPSTAPASLVDALQPGDDWFTRPEFAAQAQALREWALANKQITDIQLDPTKNKPAELAKNHKIILFKAQFVHELFDAPYPFVDDSRGQIDPATYPEADFKKGEQFFYEMQCLKCHVLGDGSVAGAQKNPTAPNLSLAHRRLQRRWVRHWVQEPAIIQIGTAMPPFFTGLNIFDIHGQPWPRSQGSSPAECERVEVKFGKTVDEQTKLLLNFLYAAGVRNFTGIQPEAPPTSTPAAKPAEAPKPAAPTPAAKVEEKAPQPTKPVEASKPAEPKPAEPAKPQAAAPVPSKGGAAVTGKVKLDGKAPDMAEINMGAVAECAKQHADPVTEENIVVDDKGNLKNVVVYVSSGLPQQEFEPPAEPAVIDQKGCQYHPHVLPVMVGQKILIKNSDEFLHNVHAMSTENPAFNFGQPNVDPGKPIDPLKTPEKFRVKCDVHTWMSAYVVGVDNPYFAVSGDDGSFSIAGLPPGEYTLTAWHEQLGTKEIPVKVESGKPAAVEVKFPAP